MRISDWSSDVCSSDLNIYGPNMGWKHVIPQLIEKVRAAVARGEDRIEIQGDGSETRAFCYVDDVVDGIMTMWQNGETMNVYHIGAMEEVPIRHLAELVADAVGQPMELVPGEAAVGGTPRRCPDIAKMRGIGYEPEIGLAEGVARTPRWYIDTPRPRSAERRVGQEWGSPCKSR